MAGFSYRYRRGGGAPTIQSFLMKDTETLTKGDLVNLESGEVDLAATADTALLGVVLQTVAGTDSTTRVEVITDIDAVYGVTDANARVAGTLLDIAGATGAMSLATDSNHDVIVVAESTAAEETLVMVNIAKHAFN